jgi:outer membrane protein OmpA-like peptidoglycan-associated protein
MKRPGALLLAALPFCPGLTIVTAVSQPRGDYESIKRVQKIDAEGTVLHYSAEQTIFDQLESTRVLHRVRKVDEESATNYLVEWVAKLPYEVPLTTSLGTSRAVLQKLKTGAEVDLSVIQDLPPEPSADPAAFDYILNGKWTFKLKRDPQAATVEVLVNGVPTQLRAIRAFGNLWDEHVEFFFLDDLDNPMALAFTLGKDLYKEINRAARADHGANAYPSDHRASLRVVRISYDCRSGDGEPKLAGGALAAGLPGASAGGSLASLGEGNSGAEQASAARVEMLEQALDRPGESVDVYDIFFSFDSAAIRAESGPTLAAIAALLGRHPDWRLRIGGHTDAISDEAYNLRLSKRRAEAVQAALTARGVAATRLATEGFGETRPRAGNDTLEGRARNRRVELTRQ